MFRTLETFLVKAAEDLSNKIFCLGLVCQEKPPAAKKSRQAAKKKPPGRQEKPPGRPESRQGRPGRLGTLVVE
jgi:hypothetical protein